MKKCMVHLPGSTQTPSHQQCLHHFLWSYFYHCPLSSQPIRSHRSVLSVDTEQYDSNFCVKIRITMSEHCSLYSVSKLLSERDRLSKHHFQMTQINNTLRDVTGITACRGCSGMG